jgi:hypothetical protein
MTRTLIGIALIAALATACGRAAADPGHHTHHQRQTTKPPGAYVSTRGVRTRMATGTYCWTATNGTSGARGCADGVGWNMYPGLPRITAAAGDRVTVALGFTPTRPIEVNFAGHARYVPATAHPVLTVAHSGIFWIAASGPRGDVSYGVRVGPPSR